MTFRPLAEWRLCSRLAHGMRRSLKPQPEQRHPSRQIHSRRRSLRPQHEWRQGIRPRDVGGGALDTLGLCIGMQSRHFRAQSGEAGVRRRRVCPMAHRLVVVSRHGRSGSGAAGGGICCTRAGSCSHAIVTEAGARTFTRGLYRAGRWCGRAVCRPAELVLGARGWIHARGECLFGEYSHVMGGLLMGGRAGIGRTHRERRTGDRHSVVDSGGADRPRRRAVSRSRRCACRAGVGGCGPIGRACGRSRGCTSGRSLNEVRPRGRAASRSRGCGYGVFGTRGCACGRSRGYTLRGSRNEDCVLCLRR
jgi:hypothetical protein